MRNILSTFEFEEKEEKKEASTILSYEKMIKEQREQFKNKQVFSCPLGCETECNKPKLSLLKDEIKLHLINDC